MIELAKKNNPTAKFAIMDSRQIDEIKAKYDGIICGFCLPYLSQTDWQKFILDCYNLMNENGLIYISFVEGSPSKSDFQVSSTGDRVYFHFYNLEDLKRQLVANKFGDFEEFKVEYKKTINDIEVHTILTAKKI
jgi:hypothetical protein